MNTYVTYYDFSQMSSMIHHVAATLGMTPSQFIETSANIFYLLESVESPASGQLHANFSAGITMDVSYNPDTLTVTHIRSYYNGQIFEEWAGSMSAEAFLYMDWPVDKIYGTVRQDLLEMGGNGHVYAGGGNDILELFGSAIAYGQSGFDTFVVHGHHGGHIRIADYQVGEKILFDSYEDWSSLVKAFQGVADVTANGFTLNFGGPYSAHWSLTIEGVALDQMRLEDLLVGAAAYEHVYAPLYATFSLI